MKRLHRSTPFRLAMAFSVAIVLTFFLASLVAAGLILHALRAQQDEALASRFEAMRATFVDVGPRALVAVATLNERTAGEVRTSLFSLRAADGTLLAGEPALQQAPDGFSSRKGGALGLDTAHGYRLLARSLGRYRLVLGSVSETSDEIAETGFAALAWASLLVLVLTAIGAALVARSMQRAVGAVGATLRRVADGHFDARIPHEGLGRVRGDDVDALVEEFNATLARLERGVEGVRQVSADIAHDLRTPLARARIRLETARDACASSAPAVAAIDEALEDLERLDGTFSALLRTAEIESGARRAHFRAFDAGALFEAVADLYEDVAEDTGDRLELVRATGTAPALVDGDRDLLAQLFANLIENALCHSPPGTTIRCELASTAEAVTFSVSDDGEGIAEEERGKVLRRLYRLEKSRTSPGSGLGLSLVKAIAELHDATLVLSDNAPGLRVTVTLPSARREHGSSRGHGASGGSPSGSTPIRKR